MGDLNHDCINDASRRFSRAEGNWLELLGQKDKLSVAYGI
jgi:hypothetical protein